jgi:hypothetical protein
LCRRIRRRGGRRGRRRGRGGGSERAAFNVGPPAQGVDASLVGGEGFANPLLGVLLVGNDGHRAVCRAGSEAQAEGDGRPGDGVDRGLKVGVFKNTSPLILFLFPVGKHE